MSDDLVKRLRQYPNVKLPNEAADYIEKLTEANLAQSCVKVDDQMRIEKLEAALREIAFARPECCAISDAMQHIARKALEGEDD